MGALAEIASVGGREQLDALLSEFVAEGDSEAVSLLLKTIDDNGLRSEVTLMAVFTLQKQDRVKPALYTKLSALNSELRKRPKLVVPKQSKPPVEAKPAGKPGRKMTLNWQHLFVVNVVDQGAFTREEIAARIGMDETPIPVLGGLSAVEWSIQDAMRAYRFDSRFEDGKYSFQSKRDWRKHQIKKWLEEGRPFPPGWQDGTIEPSKELWSGFTNLPE